MASEFYTISGDITSGTIDSSTLNQEILNSPAVPNSSYIIVREDDIEISFSVTLNPTEKTALDGVVLIHPQLDTENPDDTPNSWKSLVDPTVTDDLPGGFSVGDSWVNESSNESFICMDNSIGSAVWKSTSTTSQSLNFLFDTAGGLVFITRPPNRSELLTV